MSRIGKNPVMVPSDVTVDIAGRMVTARGRLGELSVMLTEDVDVARENGNIRIRPRGASKRARTMWGTSRSLVQNLVTGVSEGFTINLEIIGVGYRAAVLDRDLVLQLGYSHEVKHPIPDGITVACERPTMIAISGADRQRVGQFAANIRAYRRPEPYKGKGIRYSDEFVLRKEGKKK